MEENIITKEFRSKEVSSNEAEKIVNSINRKKSAIRSCILVSILIDLVDIFPLLTDIINGFLENRNLS